MTAMTMPTTKNYDDDGYDVDKVLSSWYNQHELFCNKM